MRIHGRFLETGGPGPGKSPGSETQGLHHVIRFENVGLRYGMGPEILRDISFHIPERSFQFLSGPSGAGKTTLLRLLFLSLKPTRGLISVFGKDRSRISRAELPLLRRRIGVVFQEFRLLDHMTTYENVALPLRVRGREEASYRTDVIELLKWVGLGERMHVLPPVLSGGEKQRAAIARALIEQPEILLADEPTGNVDPPLARRLLQAVHRAQPAGHCRRHRHPRPRPDGPGRRPAHDPDRREARHL